ncbi:Uncharacterised protein [Candidatus Ornithobacterium hominis]|uniref:Uncharacterized protein n=1 Tax=Candidatus Ornithobacterium hominis TaxID=2497989 RepID=A0A383U2U8_9FLAO|nr:Rod shape-determining protein MreD [Candidatus Ornithobacterium hominis]SZD73907.1 Uncharacterised protein [Candidatus Ornithobacterium hominis]
MKRKYYVYIVLLLMGIVFHQHIINFFVGFYDGLRE